MIKVAVVGYELTDTGELYVSGSVRGSGRRGFETYLRALGLTVDNTISIIAHGDSTYVIVYDN